MNVKEIKKLFPYTVKDVAEAVNVKPQLIYEALQTGKLSGIKLMGADGNKQKLLLDNQAMHKARVMFASQAPVEKASSLPNDIESLIRERVAAGIEASLSKIKGAARKSMQKQVLRADAPKDPITVNEFLKEIGIDPTASYDLARRFGYELSRLYKETRGYRPYKSSRPGTAPLALYSRSKDADIMMQVLRRS
jgi:hypothetical protein